MSKILSKSDSHDGMRTKVSDALTKAHPGNYPYVRDMYDDQVVYNLNDKTYARKHSMDDKGNVTLGNPTEMEVAYKKVGESHRMAAAECQQFDEAAKDGYDAASGKLTMTVIKPGFNTTKSRFYPGAMLKRDHKIFEGAKMFADHQTDAEAKARPEGSVRNWVASVSKVWAEADGRLRATAQVIDPPFKAKLAELAKNNMLKDMGVSIRAIGEASESVVESAKTLYVERLVKARSVDFVTYPGAGGQVEALESSNDENDVDLVTEAQLRDRRPDLITIIESNIQENNEVEKTIEQLKAELAESNRQLTEANKKAADAEKTARIAEAGKQVTKLVSESNLPKPAQDRLVKQFAEAENVTGVAEAIKAEQEYITAVGGPSKPTKVVGMGESAANGTAKEVKVDLKEAGAKLGLSAKEAEIFARGRK